MKKISLNLIFLFLLSNFLFSATNLFISDTGDSQILFGEVVNTVNGETGDIIISTGAAAIPANISVDTVTALGVNGVHIVNNSGNLGLFVANNGSVGIGTDTPLATLHLDGTYADTASSTQVLYSTDTIVIDSNYIKIVSSGGIVNITNLAAGVDGQTVKIRGGSNTDIIRLMEGGNIILNSAVSFDFGKRDKMFLTYEDSYWEEDFRVNNNG